MLGCPGTPVPRSHETGSLVVWADGCPLLFGRPLLSVPADSDGVSACLPGWVPSSSYRPWPPPPTDGRWRNLLPSERRRRSSSRPCHGGERYRASSGASASVRRTSTDTRSASATDRCDHPKSEYTS